MFYDGKLMYKTVSPSCLEVETAYNFTGCMYAVLIIQELCSIVSLRRIGLPRLWVGDSFTLANQHFWQST